MSVVPLSEAKRKAKETQRQARGTAAGPGKRGQAPATEDGGECPIRPLGHRDGEFYFFDGRGQLRSLAAQSLSKSEQLLALFCGETRYLLAHFPQLDAEDKPTGWFSGRQVNRWLVRECVAEGLFRTDEPRRGHGVWRAGAEVLLHLGEEVRDCSTGARRRAGFRTAGALWPALPAMQAPADQAATVPQCFQLEAAFNRWNWAELGSGSVFFGLLAAGMLGAAIGWRPHGLVVGPAGSGKTTLMELYAACSPLTLMWNDYTEAGLRQALTGRAGPLILDEAEGDADGGAKLQKTVELLRRTSGGSGAQVVRGSPGGHSVTFEVTCSAILGGILPPVLLPQDASRITRLDLLPYVAGSPRIPGVEDIARWKTLAPALWARALEGLPRFAANLATFRDYLIGQGGAPRAADQLGTILAARATMLSDAELLPREAAEDCDLFRWLTLTEAETAEDGGPYACWRHLLSSPVDSRQNGERPSVRRLLIDARDTERGNAARTTLMEHGLRVATFPQRPATGPPVLYVADKNPRLETIFENTQWTRGRWSEDLRRLPGASRPGTQWVLTKERCTVLPPELLPGDSSRAASLVEIEAVAAQHGRNGAWVLTILRAGMTLQQARIAGAHNDE